MNNLHDIATRSEIARRIANLCSGKVVETTGMPQPGAFVVPDDTMLLEDATRMGILNEGQLYGGVVPATFVATKIISHGPVSQNAAVPPIWSPNLAKELGDTVLRGFSAFSQTDARAAGRVLLKYGPIRLKDVEAISGRGQSVVRNIGELDKAITALDPAFLTAGGLVIEENLENVATFSVGVTRLFGRSVAYWGTQRLTFNNYGEEVYGGSQLHCVRGGLENLKELELSPELLEIIDKAERYDRAVFAAYPELFASRRNYDVAFGRDSQGDRRIGVLEQSWRVGGASGAEIAAFEAFTAHPELTTVDTSTVEVYGAVDAAPANASVYFSGVDPKAGPLTKFAVTS